jgi:hypothetical protein
VKKGKPEPSTSSSEKPKAEKKESKPTQTEGKK